MSPATLHGHDPGTAATLANDAPAQSGPDAPTPLPMLARGAGLWPMGPRAAVLAPVAVAHVWTMTWLAWTLPAPADRPPALLGWGLSAALAWGAVAALGVVIGGACLAAAGRGQRSAGRAAPPRLGGGSAGRWWALAAGLVLTGAGLASAAMLSGQSALLAGAAALGVVGYPVAGRFFPAVAVVGTGLWHALVMAIAVPAVEFAWPVLLNLTHAIVVATAARVYGLERPGLTVRGGWGVCLGWAFLALLLAGGMTARGTAVPVGASGAVDAGRWLWLGPATAVAVLAGLIVWLVDDRRLARPAARRRAARRLGRVATRWLIVYNASWLLAAGLIWPGLVVLGLAGVSVLGPRAGMLVALVRRRAGYRWP